MKLLLFIGTALIVLGLAAFTPAYADSSDSGSAVGSTSDFKADPNTAEAPAINGDLAVRDLEKATEQPMRVPNAEESGGLDMKNLIVPNQADYDAARESDIQSMMSF
jgi:hypothetical protein